MRKFLNEASQQSCWSHGKNCGGTQISCGRSHADKEPGTPSGQRQTKQRLSPQMQRWLEEPPRETYWHHVRDFEDRQQSTGGTDDNNTNRSGYLVQDKPLTTMNT